MSATLPITDAQDWKILCVDDEPNILAALRRLFRQAGFQVLVAGGGAEALQILEAEAVDLVISDMRMPGMNGAEFLHEVRQRWPERMRILMTGQSDMASTIDAINRGEIFRYVPKPWDDGDLLLTVRDALQVQALRREKERLERLTAEQNEELRQLNASLETKVMERTLELQQAHEKLKKTFFTSIRVFSNLIELREISLAGHSRRVADLARKIASNLKMGVEVSQDVFLAALLHDIGKIGFPDDLLVKPANQLREKELALYRKHPEKGEQILMALEDLRVAASMLRAHHERYDGTGFPDGLAGEDIPLGARVLAVANDFDALQLGLFSLRRYSPDEAKEIIVKGSGQRYDPNVVNAFIGVAAEEAAPKEVHVSALDLKPGMVLARDLVARDGILLLAAEHMLNDGLVRQIRQYAVAECPNLIVAIRS
ncbi:MAG: Cyclic di-GMP phosphodiesterase response regulator RpfG [Betaproteobacteria bacterium ADurb.Bin341]|nr:MAG: Cyclic di-GMP phosphodiesterase response regulator RpfG [Betaproteobacteria bacterium ADurb.Bin341]